MLRFPIVGAALCLFFSGCTIITNDHIDSFPKAYKVRQIEMNGDGRFTTGNVTYSGNRIEVDLTPDYDIFFLSNPVDKITYELNEQNKVAKITTKFTNRTDAVDELFYNANGSLSELRSSLWGSVYRLYYKSNVVDSVSKVITSSGNPAQQGFYKRITDKQMISIFPFDNTRAYTLNWAKSCSSQGSDVAIPSNPNDYNKTYHELSEMDYQPYGSDGFTNSIKFYSISFQQVIDNKNRNYCGSFAFSIDSYDLMNNPIMQRLNTAMQNPKYPNLNHRWISVFSLLPTMFSDFRMLYQLTAEDEFLYMNRYPKEASSFFVEEMIYRYEPR